MEKKIKFPDNFYWGSATAAEEIEAKGHLDSRGGKTPTIWDQFFTENKNRFFNQEFSQNNFYDKYKEDLKFAKDLNFNSLRISISWSRLLPDGKKLNPEGVKFYHDVFKEMKKQGLKIFVTLEHLDVPMFLQDIGGWTNKEMIDYFEYYAKIAFTTFGKEVDYWFTFNEPMVTVGAQWWYGTHYPAIFDFKKGLIAFWNMLVAHHKAVRVFRELKLQSEIGIVLNISPTISRSTHPKDLQATRFAELFNWVAWMDTIIYGVFPKDLVEELKSKNLWIEEYITEEEKELFKSETIDIFGVNYYCPYRAKALDYIPDWNGVITPSTHWFNDYNMVGKRMNIYRGWEINPKSLYDILTIIQKDYRNIKTFVSENGMGVENEERFKDKNGVIQDDYRIDFLTEHIYWVHKAIENGANVVGYHMWTYIDNWSWLNAYKNRYGFVELNLKTNERSWKKSAKFMQELGKTNTLIINKEIE